ncbi:MAG: hypothetical protein HY531_02205 [Chloroflexi bacterium]|nr:hypothetical protein [Chloroflexota bacterium]
MSAIRRLYFYGVAFAALMVAASGATTMVGAILDRILPGRLLVGNLATPFSLGLAMLIPSVPLWLVHWRAIQRHVTERREEAGSALRKLYLNALLLISAALAFRGAMDTLLQVLGVQDEPLRGSTLALLLVWGSLWSSHWRMEAGEGQPTPVSKSLRRWYLYITSAYGLATMVTGLGLVLAILLSGLYHKIAPSLIVDVSGRPWGETMRLGLSLAVVGGLWWGFHWLYAARGDRESVLRQVYLYLFAVLGGIVTALAMVGMLLYQTLRFVLGGVDSTAAVHFDFLASTVSPLLVGVGLWTYHWRVVQEESAGMPWRLLGASRASRYIMAFLGLASFSAGVTTLVSLLLRFLDALRPEAFLYAGPWWQGHASAAVAMLLVGTPVWWYCWSSAQASAVKGGAEERAVLPRRLFLYVVLAASLLGILGNLSFLLYQILNNLILGTLSLDVLRESQWSIGVVTAGSVFLGYYWGVLRDDQRTGAEAAPRRKEVLVLMGERAATVVVPRLSQALGTRLNVLRHVGGDEEAPALTDEQLQVLAERVASAPGSKVLLLVTKDGIGVYPYRD